MSSPPSFIGSNKDALVESTVTALSFVLGDKLIYNQPIDSHEWKKAALSFGSSYLADMTVSYVEPYFLQMTPSLAQDRYMKPLLSGSIYSLGDMIFHYDNRSMLTHFLLQVGAQAVGSYTSGPIEKML